MTLLMGFTWVLKGQFTRKFCHLISLYCTIYREREVDVIQTQDIWYIHTFIYSICVYSI